PPAPSQLSGPDCSRGATIAQGTNWSSCPFPPEADVDQVDYAVVTLVVTVRADGTARSVQVVSDPGHGFGRAARMCALSKRYQPAWDRDGNAIMATTPPIRVTFTR
ncbi:MAG TPA: energy transducer TonB, partial [Polyangiaceae bacterium]|nr:energy transducer TonB [Polyangiaceae bacterium]